MFGRITGTGNQPFLIGSLYQGSDEEQGSALHYRICGVAQKGCVMRKKIMIPERLRQPRAAGLPDPVIRRIDRCCSAPQIEVMMQHPAPSVVVLFGSTRAGFRQLFQGIEQRNRALAEG